MKIALITDTHFGAREGRVVFHDHFQRFYENVFFPICEQRGITTIIHGGDTFDRRKYIDYYSLKRCREYFFEPLAATGMRMYVLVGNHDICLRNTLEINSPDLLLREFYDIIPIMRPQVIELDGVKFLLMPWICSDNNDESNRMLREAAAEICIGHFEISGFQMYKGLESHEGFDTKTFQRFDTVFSGHYHHASSSGNIRYFGSPYEIIHSDYNDPRGFYIFDTETRQLEFIQNPYTLFDRFVYDDSKLDPSTVDVSRFKNKFVKIVVQKKTDYYKFDTFLDRVFNCGAHDIKILEDLAEMSSEELDESIDIEDTQTILTHYIENSEVTVNREELSKYMNQLYIEAVNVAL